MELRSVRGVTPRIASRIAGVGAIALITVVNGEQAIIYVDDVFYVPGAEFCFFTGACVRASFRVRFRASNKELHNLDGRETVVEASPQDATWGFPVTHPSHEGVGVPPKGPLCNYTVAEGVGSLALWHERLCHTFPQYLQTMVDKALVRGMMLMQRQQATCDACHLGKQKRRSTGRNLIEPRRCLIKWYMQISLFPTILTGPSTRQFS